jgi:two-component system cell cycle sensor histidine kinase/response regulator CckA
LLVDDDASVRRLVHRILTEDGYHIIEAFDGSDALEGASAYDGPIHLLLTDVIMPKVNGLILAERLVQERPGIAVLYMSGYVESTLLAAKWPEMVLLRKPFNAEQLLCCVREALAGSPPASIRKPPSSTSEPGHSPEARQKVR